VPRQPSSRTVVEGRIHRVVREQRDAGGTRLATGTGMSR
jgi:hypothetical protein